MTLAKAERMRNSRLLTNDNNLASDETMLRTPQDGTLEPKEKPRRGRRPCALLKPTPSEPITPDTPAYKIAKTLLDIIKTRMPRYLKGRPIKVEVWARSISNNLLISDRRDPKKVLALLEWIHTREPDLLRCILRPRDLREHYDFLMDIYNNNDFDPESDLWLNITI